MKMCIFRERCIIQLGEEMHLPGWSYAVGGYMPPPWRRMCAVDSFVNHQVFVILFELDEKAEWEESIFVIWALENGVIQ